MRRFSIVVPAYNEESSIGSLLQVLGASTITSVCHVVVVCNGCTDSTFAISSSFEDVTTVESNPGKFHALNVGDQVAGDLYPRLYLDADVKISEKSVMELLHALDVAPVRAVGPRLVYDLEGRPFMVRAFYRAQESVPRLLSWRSEHLAGRGVYGLNRAARGRFDGFPPLRADDAFVDRQFKPFEKQTVLSAEIKVSTPRSVRQLVRNEMRTVVGNRELAQYFDRPSKEPLSATEGWVTSWRDPSNLNLVVWLSIEVWVRIRISLKRKATARLAWR